MHYPLSTICSTRFNSKTWEENLTWKKNNNFKGGIYNAPKTLNPSILQESLVFILEMKNDENRLMGIGLIKNMIHVDKHYKIYEDNNYNRYTYKSACRIDYEDFEKDEIMYIQIMETLLFKGSAHSKRGHGITLLPTRITENKVFDFKQFFMNMFNRRFSQYESKIIMANNFIKKIDCNADNCDDDGVNNNTCIVDNIDDNAKNIIDDVSMFIIPKKIRKSRNLNSKNKTKTVCNRK